MNAFQNQGYNLNQSLHHLPIFQTLAPTLFDWEQEVSVHLLSLSFNSFKKLFTEMHEFWLTFS